MNGIQIKDSREQNMIYSAKAIANYFLALAEVSGKSITPMKIQKLVYMASGWHMALTNGKSLINEQVEAWKYGPVIPSLYDEFKQFGNDVITKSATEIDTNGTTLSLIVPQVSNDDSYVKGLLDKVWEVYGAYTPYQLSNMTHQQGTPWYQTWHEDGGRVDMGTDIPKERILEHFTHLASAS